MNGTSNRYKRYCELKHLEPESTFKSLPEYAQWIRAREDEYRELNSMSKADFYREEKIRIEGFTRFEMWLNEWSEK